MTAITPRITSLACALALLVVSACDSTAPARAGSIVLVAGATSGVVGQPLSPAPTFEIRDEQSGRMGGVAFTVTVTGGGGSVTEAPTRTVGDVATSVGTWTLGTTAGAQTLRVETSGVTPLTITVTGLAGAAAGASSAGGPLTASGSVGAVAAIQPAIRVVDAFGNAVSGVTVNASVSSGGTISTPSVVTDANGIASAGVWTLGPIAEEQTARLTATGAPAVVFRVAAEAGPSANAVATVQLITNGAAGQQACIQPGIRVTDAFGNGIPGIAIPSVVSAGNTIASANPVTNGSGIATVGVWTLGAEGDHTVTMTPPVGAPVTFTATATPQGYNVCVRYVGTIPSAAIQAAFQNAARRIGEVIVGDLPDIPVTDLDYATVCTLPGAPVLNETLDDLVVFAIVATIDGPGGILGGAGPCLLRSAGSLTAFGDMIFDVADLNQMQADGSIGDVILHEMLHVVGFGTLWGPPPNQVFNLVNGFEGADPQFIGAQARAAYTAAGGPAGNPNVPVENVGSAGTRDAHWRESRLGVELMTGFVFAAGNPLSAITVGALADFGYVTNAAAADVYLVFPGPGPASVRSGLAVPVSEELRLPVMTIDALGRLTRIRESRKQ
jgi:hypothetical protein